MTRSELISRMSARSPKLVRRDCQLSAEIILDAIVHSLGNGKRVEIRGFGSFSLHQRPARNARNPKTGQLVFIASKCVPHFKPGQLLLDRIQSDKYREVAA